MVRGTLYSRNPDVYLGRLIRLRAQGEETWCTVDADSEGAFELSGISPGPHELGVLLGLQGLTWVTLDVSAEAPTEVRLPVFLDDWVETCFRMRACGELLATPTEAELVLPARESLEITALRIGIAIALEGGERSEEWIACVRGAESQLQALRAVRSNIVPIEDCEMGRGTNDRPARERMRHTDSGNLARTVWLDSASLVGPDHATVQVGYMAAMLWGAGYRCDLERVNNAWVPIRCVNTWVS